MLVFDQEFIDTNVDAGVRFFNPPSNNNLRYNQISIEGLKYSEESFQPEGTSMVLQKQYNDFGTEWRYSSNTYATQYLKGTKYYSDYNYLEDGPKSNYTITASSIYPISQYLYMPYHIANTYDSYRWLPEDNPITKDEWIRVDFTEPILLERIELGTHSSANYPYRFLLQISETGNFDYPSTTYELDVTKGTSGYFSYPVGDIVGDPGTTQKSIKAIRIYIPYDVVNNNYAYIYNLMAFGPNPGKNYLQSYDSQADTNCGLLLLRDVNENFYEADCGIMEYEFFFYPAHTYSLTSQINTGYYPHGGFLIGGLFVQFYTFYSYSTNYPLCVTISPYNGTRRSSSNILDIWNNGYTTSGYSSRPHQNGQYDWVYEENRQRYITQIEGLKQSDVVGQWMKIKAVKNGNILIITINNEYELKYPIPYSINGLFGIIAGKGINRWRGNLRLEIPSWLPPKIETLNLPNQEEEIASLEPSLIFEVPVKEILTTLTNYVEGTNETLEQFMQSNGIVRLDWQNVQIDVTGANDLISPKVVEDIELDPSTDLYYENVKYLSFTISPNYSGPALTPGISAIVCKGWIVGQDVETESPLFENIKVVLDKPKLHFYIENTETEFGYRRGDPKPHMNKQYGYKYYPWKNPTNFPPKLRFYSFPHSINKVPINSDFTIYPTNIESNRGASSAPQQAILQKDNASWYMSSVEHNIIIDLGKNYKTWGLSMELQDVLNTKMGGIKVEIAPDGIDKLDDTEYSTVTTLSQDPGRLDYSLSGNYRWEPIIGRYVKLTGTWIESTWYVYYLTIYGVENSEFQYSLDSGETWIDFPEEGINSSLVVGKNKLVKVKVDKSLKLDENYLHSWQAGTAL